MPISKKVRAFSLNEMIVVLLITAIVVGMAFSVLNLVQRQMAGIEGVYEVKLEANTLRQSLWTDFNRYSSAFYDKKEERLYLINAMGTKYYGLEDGLIFTEKDTFDIQVASVHFYFNNKSISFGEFDAVELTTTNETGSQKIFVYKDNAAATYMNQNQ